MEFPRKNSVLGQFSVNFPPPQSPPKMQILLILSFFFGVSDSAHSGGNLAQKIYFERFLAWMSDIGCGCGREEKDKKKKHLHAEVTPDVCPNDLLDVSRICGPIPTSWLVPRHRNC